MSVTHLGSLVIDEVPMIVTSMALNDGKLVIQARTQAPVTTTVRESAEQTLFSPDGRVVFHRASGPGGKLIQARDEIISFTLFLSCPS